MSFSLGPRKSITDGPIQLDGILKAISVASPMPGSGIRLHGTESYSNGFQNNSQLLSAPKSPTLTNVSSHTSLPILGDKKPREKVIT